MITDEEFKDVWSDLFILIFENLSSKTKGILVTYSTIICSWWFDDWDWLQRVWLSFRVIANTFWSLTTEGRQWEKKKLFVDLKLWECLQIKSHLIKHLQKRACSSCLGWQPVGRAQGQCAWWQRQIHLSRVWDRGIIRPVQSTSRTWEPSSTHATVTLKKRNKRPKSLKEVN